MRTVFLAAAFVALPFATFVQPSARQADPDRAVKGSGLPAGWQARFDNAGATTAHVKFVAAGQGYRVTSGPAGIFYQPARTGSGPLNVKVVFSQLKAAEHPEAYGLLIGGSDLQGPNQKYTYFLLRQDGMFLIKRRAGAATPTVKNWTAHAAIKQPSTPWTMTNELAVTTDQQKAHFWINSVEVASVPLSEIDASGVAGVRINHNLDVRFEFAPPAK